MRMIQTAIGALGLAVSVAPSASAQGAGEAQGAQALETRHAAPDAAPPPATIYELHWLVGDWEGTGLQGQPAMETWSAPVGGTMVGTFIQTQADGSILFTELMYIRPVGESLEIAIKHFNPDLTGWEEKDETERFRLIAIEECAAYFHTLTIRCADKDAPGDGIVVAVRAGTDDAGKAKELVFRYGLAPVRRPAAFCPEALTTLDMNACYAGILAKADQRRQDYVSAAITRQASRRELVEKIKASEAAFVAYRDAECDAVLQDWIEGTIRGVMTLSCRIEMTDRRTHTIWQNWLTYSDRTPPVLPEPKPTR